MSPFSIIGGGGGRIRAQKWYLRYTVSPPRPLPQELYIGHLLQKLLSQQTFYQSSKQEAKLILISALPGAQCC